MDDYSEQWRKTAATIFRSMFSNELLGNLNEHRLLASTEGVDDSERFSYSVNGRLRQRSVDVPSNLTLTRGNSSMNDSCEAV